MSYDIWYQLTFSKYTIFYITMEWYQNDSLCKWTLESHPHPSLLNVDGEKCISMFVWKYQKKYCSRSFYWFESQINDKLSIIAHSNLATYQPH